MVSEVCTSISCRFPHSACVYGRYECGIAGSCPALFSSAASDCPAAERYVSAMSGQWHRPHTSHTSSHRERHENGRELPTSNANARHASLSVRYPCFLLRCGVRTVLRLPCHPYDGNKFRRVPSMRHITNRCILYRISVRCVIHRKRRVLLVVCRLVICVTQQ